jgi:hypothetical protein
MEDDANIDSYFEQEFRPLDEVQVQWLLEVAHKVSGMSDNEALSLADRSLMDVAAHQLIRLTSMTLAGFELYSTWHKIARLLHEEILIAIENSVLNKSNVDLSDFPTITQLIEELTVLEVDEP